MSPSRRIWKFDQLDASGAADDTLVILTADHGDLAGSHQLFGMNLMYEESIGVPLLVSRPGQRHDRHVHAPVGHVDIVPPVLDELGVAGRTAGCALNGPQVPD